MKITKVQAPTITLASPEELGITVKGSDLGAATRATGGLATTAELDASTQKMTQQPQQKSRKGVRRGGEKCEVKNFRSTEGNLTPLRASAEPTGSLGPSRRRLWDRRNTLKSNEY